MGLIKLVNKNMFLILASYYLLSYLRYEAGVSNLFLQAPSQDLNVNQPSDPIFTQAANNPNLEYPRRKDFVTIQENVLGQWMKPTEAPYGYYACGISIKNEGKLLFGDDSTNNSIFVIYCNIFTGDTIYAETNFGEYGEWSNIYTCPKDFYISGAAPYFEKYVQGNDNSALNGLDIYCTHISGKYETIGITAKPGAWGDLGKSVIEKGKFVCGMQVSYDNIGKNKDKLGLDGLLFKYCDWLDGKEYIGFQGLWGDWTDFYYAPREYLACGFEAWIHSDKTDSSGITQVILLYCNINDWNSKVETAVGKAIYGTYRQEKLCPQGQFIDGFYVKNQPSSGPKVDDQAITGLSFRCSLPSNKTQTSEITVEVSNIGEWTGFNSFGDRFLCGAQARIDNTLIGGDTTGLNSIAFKTCEYKVDDKKGYSVISTSPIGEWETFTPDSSNGETFACGISITKRTYYPNRTYYDSMSFIYCNYKDWSKKVIPGLQGMDSRNTYQTKNYECKFGEFISSIKVKEEKVDIDGWEVNSISGIHAVCTKSGQTSTELILEFNSNGTWSAWADIRGQYICGEKELKDPYTLRDNVSGTYGLMVKSCPRELQLYKGYWGEWSDWVSAEKDYFACGIWIGHHISWVNHKDKFGVTGLQLLFCHKTDTNQKKVSKTIGNFSEYSNYEYIGCPKYSFIVGGSVKNMPPQGPDKDDLAIYAVRITCMDPTTKQTSQHVVANNYFTEYNYDWVNDVVGSGYVCGMRAQIDMTPAGQDGTAVNGISFQICDMN
jgi:hypothetical protein